MDENRISSVKALLYDTDNDEVKRTIFQTEDQEIFTENIEGKCLDIDL